jgi:hypothetical protein
MPNKRPLQTDNEKLVADLNAIRVTFKDIRRLVKACMKDYVKGGDNTDCTIGVFKILI